MISSTVSIAFWDRLFCYFYPAKFFYPPLICENRKTSFYDINSIFLCAVFSVMTAKGHCQYLQNIPLRWLLVGTFVVQTAAAIGLTSWLALRNGEQAVHEVAQQWQQDTVKRIELQLTDYLQTPNLINQINAQSLKVRELEFKNPDQLIQRFWYQRNLFSTDSVSAIYIGSAAGDFIGLGNQEMLCNGRMTTIAIGRPVRSIGRPSNASIPMPWTQQAIGVPCCNGGNPMTRDAAPGTRVLCRLASQPGVPFTQILRRPG
jgi:hypothetical protein